MPPPTLQSLLQTPYATVDEVVLSFLTLEDLFRLRLDQRAVFVTAYLHITQDIQGKLRQGGFFHDDAWLTRYLLAFANRYRAALSQYEQGNSSLVPKSWRLSFEASSQGRALVIQDLLLGINAHINHDLSLSLVEAGIEEPLRAARLADHNRVNEVIRQITGDIQLRIANQYSAALGALDRLFGGLDEGFTNFSFEKARAHSWEMAVSVCDAQGEEARSLARRKIDEQAGFIGRLMLLPNVRAPWLIEAIKYIDRGAWWKLIGHPAGVAEER